jgi:hypothetical protein
MTLTKTATATPTFTITNTPIGGSVSFPLAKDSQLITSTPTPLRTAARASLADSMMAAPNVSRDGEQINFLINLTKPLRVKVMLYNVAGENIYSTSFLGNSGLNTLPWKLKNRWDETVTAGLYFYLLEVEDDSVQETKSGKIVVLH